MFHRKSRFHGVVLLIVGIALLGCPKPTLAQRGGGGGGGAGGGAGAPGGVSERDELKDFHRALAVQATPEQRDAFVKNAQLAQSASDQLLAFQNSLQKAPTSAVPSDRAISINQTIENARSGNQKFLASLTSAQKSGLKDVVRKLAKVDSELDKQTKTFEQVTTASKTESEQITGAAVGLEKALASFESEQLALGKEMGVVLPTTGSDLTFNLPRVVTSINVGGSSVSIPASGSVTRVSSPASVADGHNLFHVQLAADLSDLQQNISAILKSQISRSPRCGERIEIQQATLTPAEPASLVVANLHYERWICGGTSPMEVSDGSGEIEIRLTPSVDEKGGFALVSEITRVQAEGSLRNMLRSEDLGAILREEIAASVLAALQKIADLSSTLPPAAQNAAMLQKAEFQHAGAEQLSLVLEGQIQLSDEQSAQFATQLKQRLSAQGPSTP